MESTTAATAACVVLAMVTFALAGPASAAAELPPQAAEVVQGANQFAFDLYARLAKADKGNLFYSPSSLHTALAMTYAGARGPTAEQMAKVLHFAQPPEKLGEAVGKLLGVLNSPPKDHEGNRPYELVVANALWAQKGYPFRGEFIDLVRASFQAGLEELDFAGQPDPARKKINDWAAAQTKDKIKDLVPPGAIDAMTRLVLTNAIYFKSSWAEPFELRATRKGPFKLVGGKTATAAMMNLQKRFGYMESDSMQFLEMPYTFGELSMVVLLPRAAEGIDELGKSLSAKALADWLKRSRHAPVRVTMPKFTYSAALNLNDVLKSMGMTDALDPRRADFGGMTTAQDLYISDVVHKAFVAVDEKGTEAAAATAVMMGVTAMPAPEEPKVFKADHPFVFLIRHRRTGAILFVGRLMEPKDA